MTAHLPQAILWDMDGTLLDSEQLWDIAMAEFTERLGGVMSPELRHQTLGNSLVNAQTVVFDAVGIPHDERDYDAHGQWIVRRVRSLFHNGIPWMPGAQQALATLAGTGIPMALVTNTIRSLTEDALDTLGRQYFHATVCGDEVAEAKPSPLGYQLATALLGVTPRQALIIEDSPTGAQAARNANIPVLVVGSHGQVPPGPGRALRASLEGLTPCDVQIAYRSAMETN